LKAGLAKTIFCAVAELLLTAELLLIAELLSMLEFLAKLMEGEIGGAFFTAV
jgi:hypothetical protein